MAERRALRSIVVLEVAAVLAIAVIPWPVALPLAVPLLVAASASRWVRGRGWAELFHGGWSRAGIGALAGAAALALAVVVGTPLAGMVQWHEHAIVRGNATTALMVAAVVAIAALAEELALRGWLVERALELRAPPIIAILLGGFAEGIVTPGELEHRIGAGLFGIGLGWIYAGGGRSVVAPVCARVTFHVALVALEATQLLD